MKFRILIIISFLLFSCQSNKNSFIFIDNYIKDHIENGTIFDLSLDDFENDLNLTEVEWDKAYTNYKWGEARIYHFNNFRLFVDLNYRNQEDRDNGILYIGLQHPSILKDDFTDSKSRMEYYWRNLFSDNGKDFYPSDAESN